MKLEQNQVWEKDGRLFRIVQRERLEVQYKSMTGLPGGETRHLRVSKKEFCRLIKGARLLSPNEVREILERLPDEVTPPLNP